MVWMAEEFRRALKLLGDIWGGRERVGQNGRVKTEYDYFRFLCVT